MNEFTLKIYKNKQSHIRLLKINHLLREKKVINSEDLITINNINNNKMCSKQSHCFCQISFRIFQVFLTLVALTILLETLTRLLKSYYELLVTVRSLENK
jgi:hypothetical protein